MARSKLTEKQWEEITKRMLKGETAYSVAKDYPVTASAIFQRVSNQVTNVRTVANQIVTATKGLNELSPSNQLLAMNLADKLKEISFSMASSAALNASTGHRLAHIANQTVQRVDEADPEKSESALKMTAALVRMSNECAVQPKDLLSMNRDALNAEKPNSTLRGKPTEEKIAIIDERYRDFQRVKGDSSAVYSPT